MFLIFIPLFLLIPCIVYFMDLSLRPAWEPSGWEKRRSFHKPPSHALTSHMRAIQASPRYVAMRKNRPHVSGQYRRVVQA